MFQFRSPMFSGNDAGVVRIDAANPDTYRMAFLADATGQADGTGYTADESSHAHALTYSGNAQITSGKFEFDGAGDWIEAPDSLLWEFGSQFTIEVFGLEFDAVNTGTIQGVFCHYDATGPSTINWHIAEFAGSLEFRWTDGATTNRSVALGTVTTGQSYDLAVCWDGLKVYVLLDGDQVANLTFSGDFSQSNQPLRIGALSDSGVEQNFLDGRIACVMITRGEVLYDDTSAYNVPSLPRTVDTPTLTDSEFPNVVALVSYDDTLGRFRDFSRYDFQLSVAGNAAGSTTIEPFADANSIALDGVGDYLHILDNSFQELGGGAFTIEMFARHSDNTALRSYVSEWRVSGNQRSWALNYRGADATDIRRLDYSTNGSTGLAGPSSGAWTPVVDTWYHIAICRDGSNDVRHFTDGTQQGSTTALAATLFDGSARMEIGASDSGSFSFNGYLSEVRITKAARYTANFTAPSAVLPRG